MPLSRIREWRGYFHRLVRRLLIENLGCRAGFQYSRHVSSHRERVDPE